MYGKSDEAERAVQMQQLGLSLDDFPNADDGTKAGIWPENWPAVRVFEAMSTQWRMGPVGPIGLDYSALPAVMRLCSVPAAERTDTFECVRILEDEAMKVLREVREASR